MEILVLGRKELEKLLDMKNVIRIVTPMTTAATFTLLQFIPEKLP